MSGLRGDIAKLAPIDGVVMMDEPALEDGCNTPGCEARNPVKGLLTRGTRKTSANPILLERKTYEA